MATSAQLRGWMWIILSCFFLPMINGTTDVSTFHQTNAKTDTKSVLANQTDGRKTKERNHELSGKIPAFANDLAEAKTELTGFSLNSTGTTQMPDEEAIGALVYVIIFLVLYTSSVGMLILYNVNHHKKISEHEELKEHKREYERSQHLVELQKRAEVYLHYKMLYGQDSGVGTPPVDESKSGTPEPRIKKLFSRSFSLKEVPKFTKKTSAPNLPALVKTLQGMSGTLPRVSEMTSHKKFQRRFTLRPSSMSGVGSRRDSDQDNNEKRRPKRHFSLGDPASDESCDDEELSTQTWHPSSTSRKDKIMLQDVKRTSDVEKGIQPLTQPEVSRVFVLRKNTEKECKAASAEEVRTLLPEGDQTMDSIV